MRFIKLFCISGLFIFFLTYNHAVQAQTEKLPKILLDVPPDTLYISSDSLQHGYQLPDKFLIPSSERLSIKRFQLLRNIHYRLNYREGYLELLKSLPGPDSLQIVYRKYPFPLISDYYHRELKAISSDDTTEQMEGEIARESRPQFLENLDTYQSRLQKSGSIVRGIEIGSNQDLTLNSGLNLQLSGNISPDVEVVAALTDENTPIQPEGNTQTLREVDKVFVKINSPYVGGTIGDFNIAYQESEFGDLQRKLQGVTVENELKKTQQQLTYGTSRGFFHTNRFLGQEGNQGPYQLSGRNGERDIVVLAGTERVYVDGVLQSRGENNDYVIDYALAEITFTSNRLITSENRIEVDFEYTNSFQRYGRTFTGVSSRGKNLANHISYDIRLFREWDDTNNLLEDNAPLSDSEKAALEEAGDDPFAASVSGAELVGDGNGSYQKADTTLPSGNTHEFFRYVGEDNGDYRVRFTNVGINKGDYFRERSGVYRYLGPDKGQYLPVRLVPLAANKQFADIGMGIQITDNWEINGEVSVSDYDRNVFSAVDDDNNDGNALQLSSALQDTALHLLGQNMGNFRFQSKLKRQEESFSPLDRPLQPEYTYKWNLQQSNLENNQESSLEALAAYQPTKFLQLTGEFGSIDKGAGVESNRKVGEVNVSRTFLPNISYRHEAIDSKTELNESEWIRQNLSVSKTFSKFTPHYKFVSEDRSVRNPDSNSVSGFVFHENNAGLNIQNLLGINWHLNYRLRQNFLYDPAVPNRTIDQATTTTYDMNGELQSRGNLQGRFSFVFREKDFTDFFERLPSDSIAVYQPDAQFQDTSWRDRQSHLANFEWQYRDQNGTVNSRWDYQVASESQAIRTLEYIRIGENRGNFRFDSTLNEYVPDPEGDYIRFFRSSGDFENIIRLETAWQMQYRPQLPDKDNTGLSSVFKRISSSSYVKLEEQSREDNIWNIYLLNLDKFHNAGSSLRSVYMIKQDLYYNERNPVWGLLFRTRYQDNISNQFFDEDNNESRIVWDRSIQARHRFFERKLNLTVEYQNSLNKRWVASAPTRNHNIMQQAFISRFNYRPGFRWQFELDVERGIENDRNPDNLLRVDYWDIKPQISYSVGGKARATADVNYINVQEAENPFNRPIPFEMGQGKKEGDSWRWNVRFEYFISSHITINANYTGRKDARALRTIHLGQAEVRAFF